MNRLNTVNLANFIRRPRLGTGAVEGFKRLSRVPRMGVCFCEPEALLPAVSFTCFNGFTTGLDRLFPVARHRRGVGQEMVRKQIL
jgi:hypothetical protein